MLLYNTKIFFKIWLNRRHLDSNICLMAQYVMVAHVTEPMGNSLVYCESIRVVREIPFYS